MFKLQSETQLKFYDTPPPGGSQTPKPSFYYDLCSSSEEDAATAPWALVAAAVDVAMELVFSVNAFAMEPSVAFAAVDVRIAFSAAVSSAELNALKAA